MATWVKQSERSSASKTARARVEYLVTLDFDIDNFIREYFNYFPTGETVTIYVLKKLGKIQLKEIAKINDKNFDTVKKDLGLLIAMRLVDIYGEHQVLTYRGRNNKASGKHVSMKDKVDWISRFTPHKLINKQKTDRIILDTSIIRNIIESDPNALDIKYFQKRQDILISIADPAVAEIMNSLMENKRGISWGKWSNNIKLVDSILDHDFPIVPIGQEATRISGLSNFNQISLMETKYFYRKIWDVFVNAKSKEDLFKTHIYEKTDGKRYNLKLDANKLTSILIERKQQWVNFIYRMNKNISINKNNFDDWVEFIADLGCFMSDLPVEQLNRIDLVIKTLAYYATKSNNDNELYEGELNDAMDFDILYCIIYPGIICTHDNRMVSMAKNTGSSDAWRIMTPTSLYEYCSNSSVSL